MQQPQFSNIQAPPTHSSPLAHGIATEIHWVPGHSGIPGNEEADRQANLARDASGSTVIERLYTSASVSNGSG